MIFLAALRGACRLHVKFYEIIIVHVIASCDLSTLMTYLRLLVMKFDF